MNQQHEHITLYGTATGTLLTLGANISSSDFAKTIILATIGAVVSFFVSLFLKWLVKQFRNRVD